MRKFWIVVGLIALIVIDQLTKYLIMEKLPLHYEHHVIDNFFSLTYVRNDGAAFSMLQGQMWFFYLVTVASFVLVYFLYKKDHSVYGNIATTLLLAGTIGNFIDRLRFQEVIDFLSFTFFNYRFAIFNFADVFIFCGVVLLLLYAPKLERK